MSRPVIQYYYTQFVGDAISLPIIKATADFQGMALIDADPVCYVQYIMLKSHLLTLPSMLKEGSTGILTRFVRSLRSQNCILTVSQNNFFRQIRNFVIDTTAMPVGVGAGIHWQVAQATSLQNIVFNMRTDGGEANHQQVRTVKTCLYISVAHVLTSAVGHFHGQWIWRGKATCYLYNRETLLTRDLK